MEGAQIGQGIYRRQAGKIYNEHSWDRIFMERPDKIYIEPCIHKADVGRPEPGIKLLPDGS